MFFVDRAARSCVEERRQDGKSTEFLRQLEFPLFVGRDTHTTTSEAQHLMPEKKKNLRTKEGIRRI